MWHLKAFLRLKDGEMHILLQTSRRSHVTTLSPSDVLPNVSITHVPSLNIAKSLGLFASSTYFSMRMRFLSGYIRNNALICKGVGLCPHFGTKEKAL